MSKYGAVLLICVLPASSQGCKYLSARARDFSDITALGISAGSGIGARVAATRLVAVEFMAQKDECFYGWNTRNFHWTESSYGLLFASWRMPAIGEEERPERYWYDFFTTSRRRTLFPNLEGVQDLRHTLFIHSGSHRQRPGDFLNIEAGVSFLFGGLEISFKPVEVLDFLLGFFGIDISQDDSLRNVPAAPAASSSGKVPAPAPEKAKTSD